ncbi:DUF4156 domain-containing protein [Vibrio agarivorans]|uniref:DUF4156 domain-containing protein n=1 Tax=Vibrio agarivorans TaxID=153622 RepID=A0ABT7XXT7_9VIBR|nr:DUF4156 domain-containing protein [Vibrio agarivorans]MDN2480599.1 DUF4156 domain-containing protein [Vibrio agarivorans]
MLLAGCSTPMATLNGDADQIEVRFDSHFDPQECQWLGDVTGSEGHWYSYLFFTNDVMVRGAVNDLRNNAQQLGADTVYMINPQDFVTSFTVFGTAYQCQR